MKLRSFVVWATRIVSRLPRATLSTLPRHSEHPIMSSRALPSVIPSGARDLPVTWHAEALCPFRDWCLSGTRRSFGALRPLRMTWRGGPSG